MSPFSGSTCFGIEGAESVIDAENALQIGPLRGDYVAYTSMQLEPVRADIRVGSVILVYCVEHRFLALPRRGGYPHR